MRILSIIAILESIDYWNIPMLPHDVSEDYGWEDTGTILGT